MDRGSEQTYFQRKYTAGHQALERCSVSLIVTERQKHNEISPLPVIPVRMIIIKKMRNNKCWRQCGGNGMHVLCWWGCKSIQLLWKTVWRFLKKVRLA